MVQASKGGRKEKERKDKNLVVFFLFPGFTPLSFGPFCLFFSYSFSPFFLVFLLFSELHGWMDGGNDGWRVSTQVARTGGKGNLGGG